MGSGFVIAKDGLKQPVSGENAPSDFLEYIEQVNAFYRRIFPTERCDASGSPVEPISIVRVDSASGCESLFSAFMTQRDKRLFIEAPSAALTPLAREVLTDLLELSDELGCEMACVCVTSDTCNLPAAVRTFSYLGFELTAPSEVRTCWKRNVDSSYAVLSYDL
eukprot:TRINITY_DN11761_c0_g1::TRINITY_DN11761_c0_g1_i1::g.11514::m.11514 TRINITY_DN11761_c0_g1::TRINITY_DN11761_c0_g1_i1::g.11514  ORF type:complete len:164 (+),score=27.05,ODC_AZ/PF02100.12/6.5e-13 TRINITY_DN11761_c0_g1_i1:193-684(+)